MIASPHSFAFAKLSMGEDRTRLTDRLYRTPYLQEMAAVKTAAILFFTELDKVAVLMYT